MSVPLTDYKAKPIGIKTTVATDGKEYVPEEWVLEEANHDVRALFFSQVTKKDSEQDSGLVVDQRSDNNFYVKEASGLFAAYTGIAVGHRILKLQNKDIRKFKGGVAEINTTLKSDLTISVESLQV